jgi:phosphoglycolate phosphatase
MLKVVIFDLDGTLLNTLEDLGRAVNYALSLRGFPLHSLDEYRGMVGHGVRNLVTVALPKELQDDETLIDSALADFKAYYTAHIDVHTRPYAGMVEVVQQLHARGVKLAIASNKFQSGTEALIAEFFPGIPFVAVLGNRPGYPLKPDPEIVGDVLRQASASPSEAAMVGDSLTDMKTAANGGIRGIAVAWGYRLLAPSPAYTLVSSPKELLSLLIP